MKRRSFFYILATTALLLLVVGVIGFYWLIAQSPLALLRGEATEPASAIFVSKQAPFITSLLVNPDRLESLRQVLAKPAERRSARAELTQLKQALLANTEINYSQDIQPWLGEEVTVALMSLDLDRDGQNGDQPGYLLAATTHDPARSREFLQLFWQKRALGGADLVFEQYKGVKLIYTAASTETLAQAAANQAVEKKAQKSKKSASAQGLSLPTLDSLSTAVVGDRFILFANHPKVLREAINNVQAEELNITSSRPYQQALQSLKQGRIGLAFVNFDGLAAWLGQAPSTAPYEGLMASLGLTRQGLLVETLLNPSSGVKLATTTPTLTEPVGALQYIPDSSPISASGKDLSQLWTKLFQDLGSYKTTSQWVGQSLSTLEKRWGIELSQAIFSWVKGEYALAALPANPVNGAPPAKRGWRRQAIAPTSADWVFVAERPTTETGKVAIAQLDTVARKQGLSVSPLQLGDHSISIWTRLSTKSGQPQKGAPALSLETSVYGAHATIGKYEIFATSIAAMDQALTASKKALANSRPFNQAVSELRQPNNGYLYLDWPKTLPLLEGQFPLLKVVNLVGKPLLKHVRSLSVSGYGNQSQGQRGGIYIQLS